MPRRWVLSKKERKQLVKELSRLYPGLELDPSSKIEYYQSRELPLIIIVDDVPAFFKYEDKWVPHLKYLLSKGYEWIPRIVVDMGAVKPLGRGADVMAPGIRRVVGEFRAGDPVAVVDEKYGKPFVVGIALVDSVRIPGMKRGRVVRNIHRVGDRIWRLL